MTTIKMEDILPMLGISYDTLRNGTINIPCPQCDSGKGRHLNMTWLRMFFGARSVAGVAAYLTYTPTIPGCHAKASDPLSWLGLEQRIARS